MQRLGALALDEKLSDLLIDLQKKHVDPNATDFCIPALMPSKLLLFGFNLISLTTFLLLYLLYPKGYSYESQIAIQILCGIGALQLLEIIFKTTLFIRDQSQYILISNNNSREANLVDIFVPPPFHSMKLKLWEYYLQFAFWAKGQTRYSAYKQEELDKEYQSMASELSIRFPHKLIAATPDLDPLLKKAEEEVEDFSLTVTKKDDEPAKFELLIDPVELLNHKNYRS